MASRFSLTSLPDDLLAHVLRFASGAQRRDSHPTPAVPLNKWRLAAVNTAFRRAYLSNLTSLSLTNASAKRLALLGWSPLRLCTSVRHVTITPDSRLSDADVVSLFQFLRSIGAQLKKVDISLSRRLTQRALMALTECFAGTIVELDIHVPWIRRVRRRTAPPPNQHFVFPPAEAGFGDDATPDSTPDNSPPPSPPPEPLQAPPVQQPATPTPQPATPPPEMMFAEPPVIEEVDFVDAGNQGLFADPAGPGDLDQDPDADQLPLDFPVLPPPEHMGQQNFAFESQVAQSDTGPVDNLLLPMWEEDALPVDPFEPAVHLSQNAPAINVANYGASQDVAPAESPTSSEAAIQAPLAADAVAAPTNGEQDTAGGQALSPAASEPPSPMEQAIQDLGAFLRGQIPDDNPDIPFDPPVGNPHAMILQLIQDFNQMQDAGVWNGQNEEEAPAGQAEEGEEGDENQNENPIGDAHFQQVLLHDHLPCRSTLTDEALVTAITRMPNLRCLNLDRARYITDVSAFALRNLTMLESLRLCNNNYVTDLPLQHVLANLPKLRALHLQDMPFIGNGSIEALCSFKNRSELRVLELAHVGRVTDEAVKKLVNSCQNLASVAISECPKISCEAASHLSCSRSLEELYFKPAARFAITDRTPVHLSCASSKLRSLKLVGCRNITLDGIIALGNLPGLKQLHLVGLGPTSQDVMRVLGTFPRLDDVLLQGDMQLTDLGVKVLCGRRGHRFLHLALRDSTENLTDDALESIVTWCTSLRSLEVHGMFKPDAIHRVHECIPSANITVTCNGGMKRFVEGRGGVWDPVVQANDDG